MTLTPEQKAEGWIEWNGGECPIKDMRTIAAVRWRWNGQVAIDDDWLDAGWRGDEISAYRIIEAHGADAEPARPTPFPAGMDDLVYDEDGFSQPFMTGGNWPLWLPMDSAWTSFIRGTADFVGPLDYSGQIAIRVRRREPKRETQRACLRYRTDRPFDTDLYVTIDLIDGKPDLSTLKIEKDAK